MANNRASSGVQKKKRKIVKTFLSNSAENVMVKAQSMLVGCDYKDELKYR